MMSVSEYAIDVDKSIDYIFMLCQKLNINANQEDDMLSDDDIILLDNEIENMSEEETNEEVENFSEEEFDDLTKFNIDDDEEEDDEDDDENPEEEHGDTTHIDTDALIQTMDDSLRPNYLKDIPVVPLPSSDTEDENEEENEEVSEEPAETEEAIEESSDDSDEADTKVEDEYESDDVNDDDLMDDNIEIVQADKEDEPMSIGVTRKERTR